MFETANRTEETGTIQRLRIYDNSQTALSTVIRIRVSLSSQYIDTRAISNKHIKNFSVDTYEGGVGAELQDVELGGMELWISPRYEERVNVAA